LTSGERAAYSPRVRRACAAVGFPEREREMSDMPGDLLYTEEHEYLKKAGEAGVYIIGVTDYAQGELGDVVFVNLPKPGQRLAANESFGTIEAVKAVSELYSPVAGEVVQVNGALDGDPAVVNRDPYGEGWMVALRLADAAELQSLLTPAAYRTHIGE
jgi:glycine cleavage system H protein